MIRPSSRSALCLLGCLSAASLCLSACGRRADLAFPAPAPGHSGMGAATPIGAKQAPTPGELITPTPQERPARSDELLRQSEERQSDEFDLPPSR